jgi:U6 snRNA-associated Sm-like protein LSm6
MENGASSEGRDPSAFLSEIIGAPVTVKLNSGVVYRGFYTISILYITIFVLINSTGELQSVDGYMNIALERSEEFVDGKLRRSYGDAFIRGNNGLSCIQLFFSSLSILMSVVLYISAQ